MSIYFFSHGSDMISKIQLKKNPILAGIVVPGIAFIYFHDQSFSEGGLIIGFNMHLCEN